MFKKLFCLVLCALMLCLCLPVASAEQEAEGAALEAAEDGSFRVLLIADTQDTDKPQQLMLDLLEAELDAADADLVILLGDVIYGPDIGPDREKIETAIRAVVQPIVDRELPFAVAFGNHDDEDALSREEQLTIYQSFPGCLNENPDIPGSGNTCLKICAPGETEPPILLWVMDSGSYAEEEIGGYGYVTEEQNRWFRDGVAALSSGSTPVSYVFQHIPVPQVNTLIEEARAFSKGAFCTFGNPFSDWYTQRDELITSGRFGEAPCPPLYDSGQFQSWKDCGVKAAFFGHDHTNDYIATVEGIDLVTTCGIGFYSYGRGDEHGARILVLHCDRPDEYETEMVYYRDLISKPLNFLQAPHIGAQFRAILIKVILAVVLLIVLLVVLIRFLVRKRKSRH